MSGLRRALFTATLAAIFILQFQTAKAADEAVDYSFCSRKDCNDGKEPTTSVIELNGTLYGTTTYGGKGQNGVVFAIKRATGEETVLHYFCSADNCTDGKLPYAGLIAANGILYGTTYSGGEDALGTIFSVDPGTGAEAVVYSFENSNSGDGMFPQAGLINVRGTLYGTTTGGGAHGSGTVFSFDPVTGTETVIYSFCAHDLCTDGEDPLAALTEANHTVYGTTLAGGASDFGTVFSVDLATGAETVIHSFGAGEDGFAPNSSLVDVKGMLYGTTYNGGANGWGMVFSIDPATGLETIVHSFGGSGDGARPYASLIKARGYLYGTTIEGGAYDGGTAFSLDPANGTEAVLYSFCAQRSCTDGDIPEAGLFYRKGMLYGTTNAGGADNGGTVFALTNLGTSAGKRPAPRPRRASSR